MEPRDIRVSDPVEALLVEQALAMARALKQACQDAPPGQVLARAELVALGKGRELARLALEAALNEQAAQAEKKGRRAAAAPAAAAARTRARPAAGS
jgi:hypothetical protein